MIPTYRYSVLSSSSHSMMMPFDLNQEDQTHNFFTTNHNNNTNHFSSSSSSLSFPILFNPNIQGASYYSDQPNHLPSDQEAEKNIILPSRGSSWDLHQEAGKDENKSGIKLKLWKKEDGGNNENLRGEEDDGSVKWMSSKMRMMRRMMVPDQTSSGNKNKFVEEAKQQPLSPLLGADDNSTNNSSNHSNNNNNITVRVCSDCHTTKTPLWRSGPRGPKSLCNACGIRQRKARRAMAAAAAEAASANGIIPTASETYDNDVKGKKLHKKEKKKKKKLKAECEDDDDDDDEEEDEPQMKKKRKLGGAKASCHRGRKKFGFDDLTINLSKNLALQVFPQDEKEAAILLMALSYGMLHGFPSDRYLN